MHTQIVDSQRELFMSQVAPILSAAYGTAFYVTASHDASDRLVERTTYKAFERFASKQPDARFAIWYLKILVDQLIKDSRAAEDDSAQNHFGLPKLPATHDDLSSESASFDRLTESQIAAAFGRLPWSDRVLQALYFMKELSYREIAEILDAPLESVRVRLHAGRRLLLHSLGAVAGSELVH